MASTTTTLAASEAEAIKEDALEAELEAGAKPQPTKTEGQSRFKALDQYPGEDIPDAAAGRWKHSLRQSFASTLFGPIP